MLTRLLIAAAASGLAATAAAAQPAPLPDFPTTARPGECWARVPLGSDEGPVAGAQAVWTLQRGAGPRAIWSLSERAVPLAAGSGPLEWAQVDCRSGQPLRLAEAPPELMAEPAPGPEFAPPQPYAQGEPRTYPHRLPPQPEPAFAPPPFSGQGPYAEGGFPPPPPMLPEQAPYPAPDAFGPPPPFGRPEMAQARQPVAPWFGGRYLTWPGKTLR